MTSPDAVLDATIVELAPTPTVAFRVRIPMANLDLSAVFDRSPALLERLAASGGAPAGPMYGRYHQFGPVHVDVEVGFPVAAAPAGIPPLADVAPGEAGISQLPGGSVARAVHHGSYEGLPAVYDRLHEWIHAQGREDGPGPWESYVNTPATVPDAAALRTEVYWPLA